jgi:DHA2 family methylenomycin A resistance protein-like MFS transporter
VAIFGALMSAVQPLETGIRVAVYLAIGLSLLAALVWRIALAVATRYVGSDAC